MMFTPTSPINLSMNYVQKEDYGVLHCMINTTKGLYAAGYHEASNTDKRKAIVFKMDVS